MQRPPIDPYAFNQTAMAFFCHFMVSGILGPFLSPTLLALGYTPTQVGLIVAATSMCAALLPVAAGHLTDNYSTLTRAVRLCYAAAALLTVLMWSQRRSPNLFVPILVTLVMTRAPLVSLLDTLAMQVAHHAGAVYGRIRLMGSLGFIVAASCGGWWIGAGHEDRFFPTLTCLALLGCGSGLLLPEERRGKGRAPEHGFWTNLARGGERHFWVWLLAMMLHWFAFAPYQYGFSLLLQEERIPPAVMGMLWSVGTLAEVLTFASCGWIFKRFTPYQAQMIALGANLMRWLLLGTTPTLGVIVASQLLHGPGFALFYTASMQTLSTFGGGRFLGSYQGLFSTAVGGIAACLGSALAGWLHGQMAFHSVILCMLPFQLAALFLLRTTRDDDVAVPARAAG